MKNRQINIILTVVIAIFGFCFFPSVVNAKDKLYECKYDFTFSSASRLADKKSSVTVSIYDDKAVVDYTYKNDSYKKNKLCKETFEALTCETVNLSSFHTKALQSKSCPSLYIGENNSTMKIYGEETNDCKSMPSGCKQLSGTQKGLTEAGKDAGVAKETWQTCKLRTPQGTFSTKEKFDYSNSPTATNFQPEFRISNTGTRQWRLNAGSNETWQSIGTSIMLTTDDARRYVQLMPELASEIFDTANNKIKGDNGGYCTFDNVKRNVCDSATRPGEREYRLSTKELDGCTYSNADGQLDGSKYNNLDGTGLNGYNSAQSCTSIFGDPEDENSIAYLIQKILNYIKIIGPVLVLILSSIDFVKVIWMSDEDNMKKAQGKLAKRLLAALLLFLLPMIVGLMFNLINGAITDVTCGIQ